MALIVAIYQGNDRRVRKVRIKIADGEYDRPIHKLCLIATAEELADNKEKQAKWFEQPYSLKIHIIYRCSISPELHFRTGVECFEPSRGETTRVRASEQGRSEQLFLVYSVSYTGELTKFLTFVRRETANIIAHDKKSLTKV